MEEKNDSEEIGEIAIEAVKKLENRFEDDEGYNEALAVLVAGLLSSNINILEKESGADGIRRWLSRLSKILSESLANAYEKPLPISVSLVVTEKLSEGDGMGKRRMF